MREENANHLSSRTEDLLLSKVELEKYSHDCEDIYFLSQREVCLIYSCIRYASWEARWEDRDKDSELVSTLERKLLMLCARDLVKAQVATVCALTGRSIDLGNDEAVADFLTSALDFSEDGVVPAIDRIGQEEEDYSDEIASIATILGYVAV